MPANAMMIAQRDEPTQLFEQYSRYFMTLRADTPDLIEHVYRLRYQVYCVENRFEDPADFPDGLERDGFDTRSRHALLLHRPTNAFAGTIRVILPQAGAPRLPALQLLADHGVDYSGLMDEARTAELSRFAVSKTFRRRTTDGTYPDMETAGEQVSGPSGAPARIIPLMTLGLMTAALQIGIEHGMTHACAVVEPPLLRLLARNAMVLHPIGPLVSHHGLRQPCYFEVAELLGTLRARRPDLWQVVTDNGRLSP